MSNELHQSLFFPNSSLNKAGNYVAGRSATIERLLCHSLVRFVMLLSND